MEVVEEEELRDKRRWRVEEGEVTHFSETTNFLRAFEELKLRLIVTIGAVRKIRERFLEVEVEEGMEVEEVK